MQSADNGGDSRCAHTLRQLQKRQGAQNDANLLYAASEEFLKRLLILCGDLDPQRWTSHTPQYAPKPCLLDWNCL